MTTFPICERGRDENQYQHRRNGFQCLHEQVAQQHGLLCRTRRDLRQQDGQYDADGYLQHQAAAHYPIQD